MKILIATDGSPCSHQAIRRAATLLPLQAAELHVVSVANVVPLIAAGEVGFAAAAQVHREMTQAESHLQNALAVLGNLGLKAKTHGREGDPAHEIVALAGELAADILVLGAHGKNGLERLLMGSISDAVLHQWRGAVLVIRPETAN
ncbi:MAG: universal stress protein [Candidatus Sericytochromatia bacterium]|nr:universal stress protein [Candidatus Sericytochromatia bacterium]